MPTPARSRAPVQSLTASAVWLMGAKTLALAFMFLLPVVLVRQLTPHEFGLYKQVFLLVGTAVSLLPLGFGMSAYYFLPHMADQRGRVVQNILLVYVAIAGAAAALLTVYPAGLSALFHDPGLTVYAPYIGLIIVLWLPSSLLETLAVADGEARLAARFIVLLQLSRAVLLISAASAVSSVWALIVAAILQGAAQTATLAWYLSSRFAGYWRGFDWGVMRSQLAYGLPFGAATLLYWFQTDLHKYVVGHHFDAATFALYTIGCFELPLLGILNESVGSVLIPRMTQLQRDGERHALLRLGAVAMRKLAAVHVPLYGMLMVAGPQLFIVLFTEQYVAAWPIFAINISLIPLSLATTPCDAVIRAHAEHRYFLVRLRLVSTLMLAVGLWLMLDPFGLLGAITVVAVVNVFERVVTTIKAARIVGMSRADLGLFGDTMRIMGATAGAALVALSVRSLLVPLGPLAVVAGCSAVLGLTYLLLLVVLGVPTAEEWESARRLARRVRRGPSVTPPLGPLPAAAVGRPEGRR